MTSDTRWSCARVEPDVEVAPEGARPPLAKKAPERTAIDAPQHLAHQMSLVEGVVARGRARLPPRRLGGEHGGGALQSKMSSTVTGWAHPDTPEVCERTWRTSTPSCRWRRNSGQYPGDRRVDVEEPAVGQHEGAEIGHGLGRRPHIGIVSSPHRIGGLRRTIHPTGRPRVAFEVTAPDAPRSSPLSRFGGENVAQRLNRPSKLPFTSPESLMRPLCSAGPQTLGGWSAAVERTGDRAHGVLCVEVVSNVGVPPAMSPGPAPLAGHDRASTTGGRGVDGERAAGDGTCHTWSSSVWSPRG